MAAPVADRPTEAAKVVEVTPVAPELAPEQLTPAPVLTPRQQIAKVLRDAHGMRQARGVYIDSSDLGVVRRCAVGQLAHQIGMTDADLVLMGGSDINQRVASHFGVFHGLMDEIIRRNDTYQYSFSQIANWLETGKDENGFE